MKPGLRHGERFGLIAVLVGLFWCALAFGLASDLPRPWNAFGASSRLVLAFSFSLGAFIPAWSFRRQLAAAPLAWTVPGSVLGLALSTLCVSALLFSSVYVGGGSVEEVRMEPTLAGKLQWSALCVLYMTGQGLEWAAMNAPLSLPLAWASLLCLRWASRGLTRTDESCRHERSPSGSR